MGNMMPHDQLPVRVRWEKNGWEPRGYYVVRSSCDGYICSYTPTADNDAYLLGVDDRTAGGKKQYHERVFTSAQIREIIKGGLFRGCSLTDWALMTALPTPMDM